MLFEKKHSNQSTKNHLNKVVNKLIKFNIRCSGYTINNQKSQDLLKIHTWLLADNHDHKMTTVLEAIKLETWKLLFFSSVFFSLSMAKP